MQLLDTITTIHHYHYSWDGFLSKWPFQDIFGKFGLSYSLGFVSSLAPQCVLFMVSLTISNDFDHSAPCSRQYHVLNAMEE